MSTVIERVVVRLDAASENPTAIDTAARLAAHAKVPFHGIFVEDEDLLRLPGLPLARQITPGAAAEPFTVAQIELHLRAAAGRARQELAAAAQRHRLEWSFEIVRAAAASALSAATERDVVVVGGLTRPVAGHFRVDCRWLGAVETAPGPFLLARRGWVAGGAVVVLLRDLGAGSARLVETAARVAEASGGVLSVICPPAIAGTPRFEKWITERIAGFAVRLRIEAAPADAAALQRRIVELDCRLLAIESSVAESAGDRLREFAERFACDVLIVG